MQVFTIFPVYFIFYLKKTSPEIFFSCAFGDDGSYQRLFPRGAKSFPYDGFNAIHL
jgi:hypothetical protein